MIEGAILSIHDPKVDPYQIAKDLGIDDKNDSEKNTDLYSAEGEWFFSDSIDFALTGADAAIVLTEWEEYGKLDWGKISKLMRRPAWVFDARSTLLPEQVKKAGLNYWRIGDGS